MTDWVESDKLEKMLHKSKEVQYTLEANLRSCVELAVKHLNGEDLTESLEMVAEGMKQLGYVVEDGEGTFVERVFRDG